MSKLAVVVVSIAKGRPSLAIGNVLGSTIANILGAFSLGLIFYKRNGDCHTQPIFEQSSTIYSLVLLVVTILVSALLVFGHYMRWRAVGVVFIILFGVYVASISYLIRRGITKAPEDDSDSDSDTSSEDGEGEDTLDDEGQAVQGGRRGSRTLPYQATSSTPLLQRPTPSARERPSLARHVAKLSLGFLAVLISGYVLSEATSNIVDATGMSDVLAGVVILSIATTIPEKFIAVLSGHKGHGDVMLANTVGSNIFLLTLCIGIIWTTSNGSYRGEEVATVEIGVMLASAALLFVTVLLQGRWMRGIGGIMLVGYVVFLVLEFTSIHKI